MLEDSSSRKALGPHHHLRLLVVTHSLSVGGAERFASNLVSALDRERFSPALCLVTDKSTYPRPADVPAYRLGYRGLWDLPRTMLALRRVLSVEPWDVVLSNVVATNCLTGAALAGQRRKPPWVARIGMAPGIGEPRHQQWWSRAVYPLATACVVNATSIQGPFEQLYPGTAGRCLSLPNPTDFARLDRLAAESPQHTRNGVPTVLFCGRLCQQKRPDLLLRALAAIRRQMHVRLWLCGDGPLRPDVETQIAELGLGDTVQLLGFCDNPFALMRQADLLMMTSDYEGLPNALIEAQGLGLPAVATRCPFGPDEIIEDGVTGRLVERGDAPGLARAALEILRDTALRHSMSAAAVARARQRYDVSRIMPRWEQLLRHTVESDASGA